MTSSSNQFPPLEQPSSVIVTIALPEEVKRTQKLKKLVQEKDFRIQELDNLFSVTLGKAKDQKLRIRELENLLSSKHQSALDEAKHQELRIQRLEEDLRSTKIRREKADSLRVYEFDAIAEPESPHLASHLVDMIIPVIASTIGVLALTGKMTLAVTIGALALSNLVVAATLLGAGILGLLYHGVKAGYNYYQFFNRRQQDQPVQDNLYNRGRPVTPL